MRSVMCDDPIIKERCDDGRWITSVESWRVQHVKGSHRRRHDHDGESWAKGSFSVCSFSLLTIKQKNKEAYMVLQVIGGSIFVDLTWVEALNDATKRRVSSVDVRVSGL